MVKVGNGVYKAFTIFGTIETQVTDKFLELLKLSIYILNYSLFKRKE